MKIVDLKTDNRKDNNNVGRAIPVFGWRAEGTERNIRQKSYRLQVWKTESPEEILAEPFPVWDSGTVCSSSMANIPYEGKKLDSGSRYRWQVECTLDYEDGEKNTTEEAWFETGLFSMDDWKGCFIGETEDRSCQRLPYSTWHLSMRPTKGLLSSIR